MSAGLKMAADEVFNERCHFIVGSEMPGIFLTMKHLQYLPFKRESGSVISNSLFRA